MKHRNKRLLLILGLCVLVLFAAAATGGYYAKRRLDRLATGYCPKTGGILTDKQLTHAFMKNLIRQDAHNQRIFALDGPDDSILLGIINDAKPIPFLKIVRAARYNHKSIAENFAIDHVYGYRDEPSSWTELISWPSTYVYIGRHGFTHFTRTDKIRAYKKGKEKFGSRIGLLKKLNGYGNRYVYFTSAWIDTSCCRKRGVFEGKSKYTSSKKLGYKNTMGWIQDDTLKHARVVPLSNCGRLDVKSLDNYPSLRSYVHFYIKRGK